ncbi:hypothetical protein L6164_004689 [Bauhinia variegata]|uniref:Uncharacterized protein n=1 Tax=Bauhinia variegata TaxID=167791 RepID=A0ACB9PP14_BAUVA|nr:hypothetical protein L6164_004689 [Bauhinia variegata]
MNSGDNNLNNQTMFCNSTDITAFSKTEYPLAHHAKMFRLHAAVAIPLPSVYTDLLISSWNFSCLRIALIVKNICFNILTCSYGQRN